MRVLRFLRQDRSRANAAEAETPTDALGLDAFATEAPPPAARRAAGAAGSGRSRYMMAGLVALVILESVPAILWLQSRIMPEVTAEAAAPAPPPSSPPVEAVAVAPCAAAPEAPAVAHDAVATAGAARAAAPTMVAGLVSIEAPVPMHIYEGERLLGTTEAETIMLPVGTRTLELVSEQVGYRTRRTVAVQAGRTTTVRLDPPRASLHVNALPWAEVWIDNQRVGETPLGNLAQTIGPHEVVFRHPELGERRTTVLVTLKEPARVSMDLRKQ